MKEKGSSVPVQDVSSVGAVISGPYGGSTSEEVLDSDWVQMYHSPCLDPQRAPALALLAPALFSSGVRVLVLGGERAYT